VRLLTVGYQRPSGLGCDDDSCAFRSRSSFQRLHVMLEFEDHDTHVGHHDLHNLLSQLQCQWYSGQDAVRHESTAAVTKVRRRKRTRNIDFDGQWVYSSPPRN
jgi:hypothetical protein